MAVTQSLCLSNRKVLCIGLEETAALSLQNSLRKLGAVVLEKLQSHSPPDIVVSPTVNAPEYKVVTSLTPAVPVVNVSWVEACSLAGKEVPVDNYRTAPFAGLRISLTGFNKDEKEQVAKQIQHFGGSYSGALCKDCTHLVAKKPEGLKYKTACTKLKKEVKVVTAAWLQESLQAGLCKDAGNYSFSPDSTLSGRGHRSEHQVGIERSTASEATTSRAAPPGAIKEASGARPLDEATTTIPQPRFQVWRPQPTRSAAASPACSSDAAAVAKSGVSLAAAKLIEPAAPSARAVTRAASAELAAVTSSRGAASTRLPAEEANRAATGGIQPLDLPSDVHYDAEGCMFLEHANYVLVGCPPGEKLELMKLARKGCATRFGELHYSLTHIVVGPEPTPAEITAVKEHYNRHRAVVRIVTTDWLRCSCSRRQLMPADERFLISPAALAALAKPRAAPPVATLRRNESGTATLQTCSSGPSVREDSRAGPRVLDGLWFTLAAIKGEEDENFAAHFIHANGGKVFSAQTTKLVRDRTRAYAICPGALLHLQALELMKACPDFKMVEPSARVTLYWLEQSCDQKRLLPQDMLLCRPMPYALPLPSMERVVVTASGYTPEQKARLHCLAKHLGGGWTIKLTRRNTHILMPFASGDKYTAALNWGVTPVCAEWLLEVAHAGRMLPEAAYQPKSASSAGAGDNEPTISASTMPSQFGPTQLGLGTSQVATLGDLATRSAFPGGGAGGSNSRLEAPGGAFAGFGGVGDPAGDVGSNDAWAATRLTERDGNRGWQRRGPRMPLSSKLEDGGTCMSYDEGPFQRPGTTRSTGPSLFATVVGGGVPTSGPPRQSSLLDQLASGIITPLPPRTFSRTEHADPPDLPMDFGGLAGRAPARLALPFSAANSDANKLPATDQPRQVRQSTFTASSPPPDVPEYPSPHLEPSRAGLSQAKLAASQQAAEERHFGFDAAAPSASAAPSRDGRPPSASRANTAAAAAPADSSRAQADSAATTIGKPSATAAVSGGPAAGRGFVPVLPVKAGLSQAKLQAARVAAAAAGEAEVLPGLAAVVQNLAAARAAASSASSWPAGQNVEPPSALKPSPSKDASRGPILNSPASSQQLEERVVEIPMRCALEAPEDIASMIGQVMGLLQGLPPQQQEGAECTQPDGASQPLTRAASRLAAAAVGSWGPSEASPSDSGAGLSSLSKRRLRSSSQDGPPSGDQRAMAPPPRKRSRVPAAVPARPATRSSMRPSESFTASQAEFSQQAPVGYNVELLTTVVAGSGSRPASATSKVVEAAKQRLTRAVVRRQVTKETDELDVWGLLHSKT